MPWARKSAPPIFVASSSNTSMNSAPMILRFFSGSVTPSSAAEEIAAGVHVTSGMLKRFRNSATTCSASPCAQQAVVDEDAGELFADRLVDQHRGNRAVDAARQPADHPALADLFADVGDLGIAEARPWSSRPRSRRRAARNWRAACRRRACARPQGGTSGCSASPSSLVAMANGAPSDWATTSKPGGKLIDAVAVAHPHLMLVAHLPEAVEQGEGETMSMNARPNSFLSEETDLAAKLLVERLLAVADAEQRQRRCRTSTCGARGLPRRSPTRGRRRR